MRYSSCFEGSSGNTRLRRVFALSQSLKPDPSLACYRRKAEL
jgi:hypothetical protein